MVIGNVWVFAQGGEGAATSATLELLTKARGLGGNVAAFVAGDATSFAAQLGEYGAQKVYATGDLGGALPGASVAAAMQAVIAGGDAPDLLLFPQNYEGRDTMARLSVKLDKTVLTNNVDIAVDGDQVRVTTPVFGGNTLVTTAFTGDAARVVASHVEESTGPKLDEANVVVSGGRGLGEAGKFEMIEQLARMLKGAAGAPRAMVDAGWGADSMQGGQNGKG